MNSGKFVPVEAIINGKQQVWFLDISRLGINSLIKLKKELEGTKVNSISSIDAIILYEAGYKKSRIKGYRRDEKRPHFYKKKLREFHRKYHHV